MARLNYVFLELAFLAGVATLAAPVLPTLRWRRVASRVLFLFVLWVGVDLVAVNLGLWTFPPEGTLPIRLLGLPLEEYVVFLVHSFVCLFLITMLRRTQ